MCVDVKPYDLSTSFDHSDAPPAAVGVLGALGALGALGVLGALGPGSFES